jgi:hypothetical protein
MAGSARNTENPGENVKIQESIPDRATPVAFQWRARLKNRDEKIRYLRNAERYWYSKEWYGSERRKTEA